MMSVGARSAAALIVVATLAIYYAGGIGFQLWPDTAGYLLPALGLAGEIPFGRPGGRTIGYPVFIALAVLTPAPLLVLVSAQAALVVAAFVGLSAMLRRVALPALVPDLDARRRFTAAILVGVAAATLYSIVHVQIAAVLTEVLFAVLALASVGAAIWFCRLGRGTDRPWLAASAAMIIVGANLTVKPHWVIAGGILAIVVALRLWFLVDRPDGLRRTRRMAAIALPFVILGAWVIPDRMLAMRFPDPGDALFGPRTAFCNHMHLIRSTLIHRPTLTLTDDPQLEAQLRDRLQAIADRRETGWSHLGFNGDSCTFDAPLSIVLNRFRPDPGAQARLLTGALLRAVLADPLPYARKFSYQMLLGFSTAFTKFAHHAVLEPIDVRSLAGTDALGATLQRGAAVVASTGPLGSREALKNTIAGRAVHAALAVFFFTLTALLCGLALVTLVVSPLSWRRWDPTTRRNFAVYLVVPLAAILGHHAVVALTHSFDVWRYGFNMFFVNLLFVGTAGAFWFNQFRVWRPASPRAAETP